jgi:hypothetical protein
VTRRIFFTDVGFRLYDDSAGSAFIGAADEHRTEKITRY